jgi:plasmid stabilization system protein ParE
VAESLKKRTLSWSRRSARDLLEIEAFIARDSQAAADDVIGEIIGKALLLEANPLLGKRRAPAGYRELVLTRFPFTIIYRPGRDSVIVSRVLHQSRQFP